MDDDLYFTIIVTPDDDIVEPLPFKNPNINNNQDLPRASFRLVKNSKSNDVRRKSHGKLRKQDSYFRYIPPTPEELMNRVEYDMDGKDEEWLKMYNDRIAKKYDYEVSETDFEKIMDRLEKESFFEKAEVVPEVDEDAVCAICNDGDCHNANVILFCDMCDLAVHQDCYGVPYIPEAQWLCRRCLQSPSTNVSCVLCPNKGGAFKQTDDNRWAHVICALWVPEVCFANTVFLEPIDSIEHIPAARWKLTCYICKQKRTGACIQCHKPNCYVPFHVTCAQQAGLYMKIQPCRYENERGQYTDVKKEAFCDAHAPTNKGYGGMYDESDEGEVDSRAYRKWKQLNRDKMKKARKILAEKRHTAFNPIAEPKLNDDKLNEISKLLTYRRGRRKSTMEFEKLRREFMKDIKGYWLEKRRDRNGVPLLRRLQVSYNNSTNPNKNTLINLKETDKDKYTKLRYDLEKARLLVGEVKKRELLKKRLFKMSREVVERRFEVIDNENPPTNEDDLFEIPPVINKYE